MRHLGSGNDAAVEVLNSYGLTIRERKRVENRLVEAMEIRAHIKKTSPFRLLGPDAYQAAHQIAAQIVRERP